jgi:hypothetical protein
MAGGLDVGAVVGRRERQQSLSPDSFSGSSPHDAWHIAILTRTVGSTGPNKHWRTGGRARVAVAETNYAENGGVHLAFRRWAMVRLTFSSSTRGYITSSWPGTSPRSTNLQRQRSSCRAGQSYYPVVTLQISLFPKFCGQLPRGHGAGKTRVPASCDC